MIEFIRHALGLCGEHYHPTIWSAIFGTSGLVFSIGFIKFKLKNFKNEKSSKKHNETY